MSTRIQRSGDDGTGLSLDYQLEFAMMRLAMQMRWLEALSVIGSIGSLIGVGFALWQILKTRKAAEAAQRASNQTHLQISKNVLLTDVATCKGTIEEVKGMMWADRYDAAAIRLTDVTSKLNQLQRVVIATVPQDEWDGQHVVTQLSIAREELERKAHDPQVSVNKSQIAKILSDIADGMDVILARRFSPGAADGS